MNIPAIYATLAIVAFGVLSTGPIPPSRMPANHPRIIVSVGLVVMALMLFVADALARVGGDA